MPALTRPQALRAAAFFAGGALLAALGGFLVGAGYGIHHDSRGTFGWLYLTGGSLLLGGGAGLLAAPLGRAAASLALRRLRGDWRGQAAAALAARGTPRADAMRRLGEADAVCDAARPSARWGGLLVAVGATLAAATALFFVVGSSFAQLPDQTNPWALYFGGGALLVVAAAGLLSWGGFVLGGTFAEADRALDALLFDLASAPDAPVRLVQRR